MKLDPFGKLFLASLAAWGAWRSMRPRCTGSPAELQALTDALVASPRFQQALNDGWTPEDIVRSLDLREYTAEEWEQKTGIPWPL